MAGTLRCVPYRDRYDRRGTDTTLARPARYSSRVSGGEVRILRSQSLRDPGSSDLEAPEPGPADADWMLRPPRPWIRRAERLRQRVPAWVRRATPDVVPTMVFIVLALWVSARFWK